MRFMKCGSKLFRPDAVTAVDLFCDYVSEPTSSGHVKTDAAMVVVPGATLIFRGAEAAAVRAFFGRIPVTDLLRRDEDEAPEAVAANHSPGEC